MHALPATIDALRTHVFNGVIWPDFSRLPNPDHPVLDFVPIAIGEVLDFGGRCIEVLPAVHTVPAVGFALRDRRAAEPGAWVFTGDTGPNPALWERLAQLRVATLVIETAFGDDEIELARISRHLCPALLGQELAQLEPAGGGVHHPHQTRRGGRGDDRDRRPDQPHRIRALVTDQRMWAGA